MKKLSVIVPVYNAEKFLERCVKSILNQTYSNVELILVNDGSKDNSLALCNKLATEDPRIVVVDKPNGGAASARNKGIEVSTGEYIGFCDSDDFFDIDTFETLISAMEKENLSTIECLSKDLDENLNVFFKDCDSRELIKKEPEQTIQDIFLHKGNVSLCTRVTRAEVIKQIKIPEGRRVEDFYFTIMLLLKTNGTSVYKYPFYNCITRDGSVTRGGGGAIYIDALYFYRKACEDLKDYEFNLKDSQQYYLFKIYYLLSISATRKERRKFKDVIKQIKRDLSARFKDVEKDTNLLRKEKFVLKIARRSFLLARLLYLVKNILKR